MEPTDERSAPEIMTRRLKKWQDPDTFGFRLLVLGMVIALSGEKIFRAESLYSIGMVISLIAVGLIGLNGVLVALALSKGSHWWRMGGGWIKKPQSAGKHPDTGFDEGGESSRNPRPTS